MNLILLTDSYKLTHWGQYPPKTQYVHSYFESRGGEYDEVVFFGLQYILKKYLTQRITIDDIYEASDIAARHFKQPDLFNIEGWKYICSEYGGYLPLTIHAVPEGTLVPVLTPMITVENTDPKCWWLTNFIETLLVQVWYPITVATISYNVKQNIKSFLEQTGTPEEINFKLHDFGFRGVSSVESAGIGGCAHLTSFMGTDTLPALQVANDYYNEPMAGYSIPASEHSTMTAWSKRGEKRAYDNMIDLYGDKVSAYSVVSDSYDIYKACDKIWGKQLKDKVLNTKATLVIRPDSGNSTEVVLKILNILAKRFGTTKNDKGYKVLDMVRLIWGDGLDSDEIGSLLYGLQCEGWSADNIAFGMGGGLLQKLNRDTHKFAFKCSNVTINGRDRGVYKEPITDKGKRSKSGKFDEGLIEVFRNGKLLVDYHLSAIRGRLNENVR